MTTDPIPQADTPATSAPPAPANPPTSPISETPAAAAKSPAPAPAKSSAGETSSWMQMFEPTQIDPNDEMLAADREMMGQVLTFCAFVGGLALAGLLTTIVEGNVVADARARAFLVPLQLLLALTSIVALFGAFMAMLGFVNHSRLLARILRLQGTPQHSPEYAAVLQDAVGKYANILVFKWMSRLFGSISMATATIVVFVATMMVSMPWAMALFAAAMFMLVMPIVAAFLLQQRMKKESFAKWIQKPESKTPAKP